MCGGSGETPTVPCDYYSRGEFYVPGVLIVKDKLYPVAKHPSNDTEIDLERPFTVVNHAVTPVSYRCTRYFYSTGPHRDYAGQIERKRDALIAVAERAFLEDKRMIEAQQRVIDATPRRRFIPTSNDRGALLFKQIAEKLGSADVKQESGA